MTKFVSDQVRRGKSVHGIKFRRVVRLAGRWFTVTYYDNEDVKLHKARLSLLPKVGHCRDIYRQRHLVENIEPKLPIQKWSAC